MESLSDHYDNYINKHIDKYTKKYPGADQKYILKKIAYKYCNSKKGDVKAYWLVFDKDEGNPSAKDVRVRPTRGNREDCDVYNSNLVYCYTKEEALIIVSVEDDVKIERLSARKMKLLDINSMNKYFY